MRSVARLGLYILVALSLTATSCGLDGVRGTIVSIDGHHHVVRDFSGREHRVVVDEQTHKDAVAPGDEVRVFVTQDGHADYLMKLNHKKGRF